MSRRAPDWCPPCSLTHMYLKLHSKNLKLYEAARKKMGLFLFLLPVCSFSTYLTNAKNFSELRLHCLGVF